MKMTIKVQNKALCTFKRILIKNTNRTHCNWLYVKKITILGFPISFQTPFEKFWAYLGQVQYTKPVCVAHPPPKAPYMKPNISYTDTTMPKLSFIHCMQIAFAPDQFCFCISIFGEFYILLP